MCNCGGNTQPREVFTSAQAQAEANRLQAEAAARQAESLQNAQANAGR